MGLKSRKILGINISTSCKKEILEYLEKSLKNARKSAPKSLIIVTPNPEQLVYARENSWFADVLNRADISIPDGIGVVLGIRVFHAKSNLRRIPGIEFMQELVKLSVTRRVPIALIGGRGQIAIQALECLKMKHPGLRGWATEAPELQISQGSVNLQPDYFSQLTNKIQRTGVGLVFVGLGAPKQEIFCRKLADSLKRLAKSYPLDANRSLVLMSVGGSFDILVGKLKRAPLVIRVIGFEWAWRLLQQPWRWKRQLALVKFLFLVLKEKTGLL